MLSKNIRKVFLGIIAGFLMITSIPFSALAQESNTDNNIELSLVNDDAIYVGDEFAIKVENKNNDDQTLIEIPKEVTFLRESEENMEGISVANNILSISSNRTRTLFFSANKQENLKFVYTGLSHDQKQNLSIDIFSSETEEVPSIEETEEITIPAPETYAEGDLEVDINDFDGSNWVSDGKKIVNISMTFGPNEVEKRIKINLAEGMEYVKYPVSNPTEAYHSQLPQQMTLAIDQIIEPKLVGQHQSRTGEMEYIFKKGSTTNTVSLQLEVGVRGVLMKAKTSISSENIQEAIIVEGIKGTDKHEFKQSIKVTNIPRLIVGGTNGPVTAVFGKPMTVFVPNQAVTRDGGQYLKKIEIYIPIPEGAIVESVVPNSGFNHKETTSEYVIMEKYNHTSTYLVPVNDNIKIRTENMPQGSYTAQNKVKYIYTYYDNTTYELVRTNGQSVVYDVKGEIPNKLTTLSRQGYYDEIEPGYSNRIGKYYLKNDRVTDKVNQSIEFKIPEGILAEFITIPFDKNEITEIFYKTNKKELTRGTPTVHSSGVMRVDKSELGLAHDEYITYLQADLGDFSADYMLAGVSDHDALDRPDYLGVYGKTTSSFTSGNIEVRLYSEGNADSSLDIEHEFKLPVKQEKNIYKEGTIIQSPQFPTNASVNAGEQITLNTSIRPLAGTTTLNAMLNPSLFINLPEGSRVIDVKATQNGKDVLTEISEPRDTDIGKIVEVKTSAKIGQRMNGAGFTNTDLNLSVTLMMGNGIKGSFPYGDMFFFGVEKGKYTTFSNGNRFYVDSADINNNGDKQEQFARLGATNSFLTVNNTDDFMLDSYIEPTGKGRQPEFDINKPETAVGFTPTTEGDYTLEIANNTPYEAKTHVYIPIPKLNQDFGNNFQSIKFPFNMELFAEPTILVKDQNGNDILGDYKIGYSSIATKDNYKEDPSTPTASSQYKNQYSATSNMIRVSNITGIKPGETAKIIFKFKVSEDNDVNSVLGKVLDFQPEYFLETNISGSIVSGTYPGTRVGIILEIGEFKGYLFVDENFNSVMDSGEVLANKEIIIKDSKGQEIVPRVKTGSDGSFHIENLSAGNYTLDFREALDNKFGQFTHQELNKTKGSIVPNKGESAGVMRISPTDTKAKAIYVGVIPYGDSGLSSNISVADVSLIEPHPDNQPHITEGKKTTSINFKPADVSRFFEGSMTATVEDPSVAKVTVVNNKLEVTALRGPNRGENRETDVEVYSVDYYGVRASTKFKVKVRANDRPIISVNEDYIKVPVGTPFSMALDNNVSLSDPQEPNLDKNNIRFDHPVDMHKKAGVYQVKYNFEDEDGNAAEEVTRTVVYYDDKSEIHDCHLIQYNKSYSIKLKDYPVGDPAKKREAETLGGVKVTKIVDSTPAVITYEFGNYKQAYGNQSYNFKFNGVSGSVVTRTINVTVSDNSVDAGDYTLHTKNAFMGKEDAAKIVSDGNFNTVAPTLTGAVATPKAGGADKNLVVRSTDKPFAATPGKYVVTLGHDDIAGKTITATIEVLDFDVVKHDGQYVIGANHFVIGKDDVKEGKFDLVNRASAKAYEYNGATLTGIDTRAMNNPTLTDGDTQAIKFSSNNPNVPANFEVVVNAKVEEGKVVNGDEYIIKVKEALELEPYQAVDYHTQGNTNTNDIIGVAEAKAYRKDDLDTALPDGTVEMYEHTFDGSTDGVAKFRVVAEPATTIETVITVKTDSEGPKVDIEAADKEVTVAIGGTVPYETGVTATDRVLNTNIPFGSKLTYSPNNIDTSVEGVYKVVYTATDANGKTGSNFKVVTVTDRALPEIGNYYIVSNNIMDNVANYEGLSAQAINTKILADSNAHAVHKTSGEVKDVVITDNGGFEAKVGKYTLTLKLDGQDNAITDTAKLKVVLTNGDIEEGTDYYITAVDKTVGNKRGREIVADTLNNELMKDMEVYAIHKSENIDVQVTDIQVDGKPVNANAGTSSVKFTVKADNTPKANITKDLKILAEEDFEKDGKYNIAADPFVIGRNTLGTKTDEQLMKEYAKARAWEDEKENVSLIVVVDSGLDRTDGSSNNQTMTFRVANQNAKITIAVTVVGGNTVVTDDYILSGNNFEINGKQALMIKNETQDYEDELLGNDDAAITTYKKGTLEVVPNVVEIADKSEIDNKADTYDTKYRIIGDTNTAHELKLEVTVDMGTAPVLTANKYTELTVGTAYTHDMANIGGTAANNTKTNIELGDLDLTLVEGSVNKDEVGVYELTYHFTDDYGLSTKVKHLVVVNDGSIEITNDYIIYAENVILKVSEVKSGAEGHIKTKSKAKAWVIDTGAQVADSDLSANRGNLAAVEGETYDAYILVKNDNNHKKLIKVTVAEEYEEGDNYYLIIGKDTTIGTNTAEAIIAESKLATPSTELLQKTMGVKALHKTNLDEVSHDKIKVDGNITTSDVQSKSITFTVKDDLSATTTKTLKVIADEEVEHIGDIYIAANSFKVGRDSINGLSDADYIKLAGAHAWNDKTNAVLDSDIKVLSKLDANPSKPTLQTVTFGVDGTDVKVTVNVEITGGKTEIGDTYVLSGQPFTISRNEAKEIEEGKEDSDQYLLNKSAAALTIYLTGTNQIATDAKVVVLDSSQIKEDQNLTGYPVKFGVMKNGEMTAEAKPILELNVAVSHGTLPTLNIAKTSQLTKNTGVFDPSQQFLGGMAKNDKDTALTYQDDFANNTDPKYGGHVTGIDEIDVTTVGVYEVVYSYLDSYDNPVSETHLVIVTDGSIQETSDHVIYGENVVLKVSEVDSNPIALSNLIKTKSKAYAYDIELGKLIDDSLISVDSSLVKAKGGRYIARIYADQDPIPKDIVVYVTEGDYVEGDEYIIMANDTTITEKEADLDPETLLNPILIERARVIAIHKTKDETGTVKADHNIDSLSTPHNVKYYVENDAEITKSVKVNKSEIIVNDGNVYIEANNVIIPKKDVEGINADLTKLIDLSKARGWHETDTANIYPVFIKEGTVISETNTNPQIVEIHVKKNNVELDKPVAKIQVLVVDGEVEVGDTHTLTGKDFTLTGKEVTDILADTTGAYDALLMDLDHGNVKSYLNKTTIEDGTPVVLDTSNLKVEADKDFIVKYGVKVNGVVLDKPVLELKVRVVVADKPSLNIVKSSTLAPNGTFDKEAQFNSGKDFSVTPTKDIQFNDPKLVVNTDELEAAKKTNGEYKVGVYKVIYTYTDASTQLVSVTHTVAVNDGSIVEERNYFIYGENAAIKLADIKGKNASELNTLIRPLVKPQVTNKNTGEILEDSRVTLLGYDDIVSKQEVGTYTLTVAIDGATTSKKVIVEVTNGTIVEKDDYILTVGDTTVTVKEVDEANLDAKIIQRSGTKAMHKTSNIPGTVTVDTSVIGKVIDETYTVHYKVTQAPSMNEPAGVKVIDDKYIGEDKDVYIKANSFVIGTTEVAGFNAEADFAKYIAAANAKAWSDVVDAPVGGFKVAVKESTKLPATAGNYQVEYYVVGYPNAKVLVDVKVTTGKTTEGADYTLSGKDINISSQVAQDILDDPTDMTNRIFTLANIEVYPKGELTPVTDQTVLLDKNNLAATGGSYKVYFTVDGHTDTKLEINVRVSQGLQPTFTVDERQVVNVNNLATYQWDKGFNLIDNNPGGGNLSGTLVDKDTELTYGGDTHVDFGELTVDANGNLIAADEGLYVVTYTTIDNNKNEATAKQLVIVESVQTPIVDKYAIYANNVTLDFNTQVDGKTDAQILALINSISKGYAVNTETFERKTVSAKGLGSEFAREEGTYKVPVSVDGITGTVETDILVTVTRGNVVVGTDYTLVYRDAYTTVKEISLIADASIQSFVIEKAHAKAIPNRGTGTATVKFDNVVSKAEGEYPLDFYVLEDTVHQDAKGSTKLVVKDSDEIVESGDFVITANNFPIGILDIEGSDLDEFVRLSGAEVRNVMTNETTNPTHVVKPVKTVGLQDTTFSSTLAEDLNITVKANVIDGHVIVDEDYYIKATPVETNVENVVIIVDELANNDETKLKALTSVKAYRISDDQEVTAKFISSDILKEAGEYTVIYAVDDKQTVEIEIPVSVSKELDPELIVSDYIEIKKDDSYDLKTYASATDKNKGTAIAITDSNITHNVDNTVAGFYKATYTITDANLNTASKTVTVFVNDGSFEVIGDYIVSAKNFVINKDLVSQYEKNAQILNESEVKATNWKTNVEVSRQQITVKDAKGYSKTPKVYENIELQIVAPANVKKINAEVTDKNVVTGDLYTITSKSTIVGQFDAKEIYADNTKLLTAMGVEVTKRVNDVNVPEGTAQIDNWSEFSTTPDVYTMKFSVVEEDTTVTEDDITVMDRDDVVIDGDYMIAANRFYVGKDDYRRDVPANLVKLADAYATRTTNNNTVRIPVEVNDYPHKDTGQIDLGPNQVVKFHIKEHASTIGQTEMTVLDGSIAQTENYYVQTQNASRPISDLKELQKGNPALDIFDIMRVKVFERGTNTPVTSPISELETDISVLVPEKTTYDISFSITENGKKSALSTSDLALQNGEAPEISIPEVQNIDVNAPVYNKLDGLVMSDLEDDANPYLPIPKLTAVLKGDDVVEQAIIDKKVGVYTVEYSVTDYDNNTSFAYQTVVINDGSIVIKDGYALEAKHFTINTKDVVVSESQLKDKTEAKAYKLGKDDELVDVKVESSTYSKTPGVYDVLVSVADKDTVNTTVQAIVTKDQVMIGEEYDLSATKAYVGKDQAKAITQDKDLLIDLALANAVNKRTGDLGIVEVVSHTVTESAGIKEVVFKVSEEETTTITVPVEVLNSKYVIMNKEHVLVADDFYIGLDDIAKGIDSDGYVTQAGAYAFDRYDSSIEFDVETDMSTTPTVVGKTPVTYSVKQNSLATLDVEANVLKGNVVQGPDHYIKAEDTTIYVSQASEMLKGNVDLLDLVDIYAADYDGNQVTVEVKEHNIEAEHGTYYAIFKVVGFDKPEVKVEIKVDKGNKPGLIVPTYTEVNKGGTFNNMAGVSVTDDRDDLTELLAKVEVINGSVDTSIVGVYELEYSVTDTDFNTTTAKTFVVVNDGTIVIQDGYILEANNFLVSKNDVTGTNQELIENAEAHAYKIADHTKADVVVLENGNYTNTNGKYTVKFGVTEKQTVTKTITAEVVNGTVVEGEDYYLSADDITLGQEDVATMDHNAIIDRANAKAVHKTLGTSGTVVIDSLNLKSTPNDYPVTYKVVEDNTVITKNIKVLESNIVIENDEYVITADNFFVGDKFILEMNKADLVTLANARAYKKSNPDVSIDVTQVEDIKTSIGTHQVTFAIVEHPSVSVQVTKTIFKDTMYFIEAKDAEIKINDLTKAVNSGMLETTILNVTEAKGYKINEDGSKEDMLVYIGNKNVITEAKAGTAVDVSLTLVDPNRPAGDSRTLTSTHRVEEANTTVKLAVSKDIEGNGNNKGKGGTNTGIASLSITFLSMMMTLAALILAILVKKKRQDA